MKKLLALITVLTLFAVGGCTSTSSQAAQPVATEKPPTRLVALTFDDGPDPAITPIVLDILKEHGVKATFFVMGQNAEMNPELLQRIVAEGHIIGNHGYWNGSLAKLSYNTAYEQLLGTQQIVQDATGHTPLFVRYPLGAESPDLQRATRDLHLVGHVGWHYSHRDVGDDDWQCKGVEPTFKYAQNATTNGAIILAHDANEVKKCAGQIVWLEHYLDWAEQNNVQFGLLHTANQPNPLNENSWVKVVPVAEGQHWK